MALAKTLFGALTASVGASECVNATLSQMHVAQVETGCSPTDVAVDASGNVWITTDCFNSVWLCPVDGECWAVGSNYIANGIAVDDTTVYISRTPSVFKCTLNHYWQTLDCLTFGENWDEAHRLDLDHEGNLLVTNGQHYYPSDEIPFKTPGVWRCSPSADCVLLGGGNDWFDTRGVAADSKGNVYVSGINRGFLKKCTSAGTCKEFGSQMGVVGQGPAVGPDDYVYTTDPDAHSFTRCSSDDDLCETFAPDGFPSGPMTIDQNGVVYTVVTGRNTEFSELTLVRSCFDSPTHLLV